MKKLNILIAFFLISSFCKASDTISVWHIFYNKIKIKEYNGNTNRSPLILKASDYKIGDSITVKYYSDTRCQDCLTGIVLKSKDNKVTMVGKNIGRGNPIKFPVIFLMDPKRKRTSFQVLYMDSNGNQASSEELFEVEVVYE
jgi:hypothetical protein